MPIRFNDDANRYSYAKRSANETWRTMMRSLINPEGQRVADIGCGGGIYTKAWLNIGAASVVGMDSSSVMLEAAREECKAYPAASFIHGDAREFTLSDESVTVVFERALIHHLTELTANVGEAFRTLSSGGVLIVQDRTPDDVALPGNLDHFRGYFFECFPQLLPLEQSRRWPSHAVITAMENAGFESISVSTHWEVRRAYANFQELACDLRQRTGRSILHELTDGQLEELISYLHVRIEGHIATNGSLIEQDRWTLWVAHKP